MIVATTLVATIAFALGLRITGMLQVTTDASATARAALAALNDKALDDAARERAARDASVRLFRATGAIALRAAASLALFAVPAWIAHATGLAPWPQVSAFLVTWQGLLLSAVAGTIVFLPRSRA